MAKDTREKLIQSAIELFWLQGYGNVSVEDICRTAGVQKGSFYNCFASKMALVLTTFDTMWCFKRDLMDSIFTANRTPAEQLHLYCDHVYNLQKEKAEKFGKVMGCPFMTYGAELCTQDETVRQKVDEIFASYTRYFETMLRTAGITEGPDIAAQEMLAYISGVMVQARIKNDIEVIRRDLEPGLRRYLESGWCRAA